MNENHEIISLIIKQSAMDKSQRYGLLNEGSCYISTDGMARLLSMPKDEKYPQRNIAWTDDFTVELPIRLKSEGVGAIPPTTLIEQFRRVSQEYGSSPAMSVKQEGKWKTINFSQYYNLCIDFAASLIALQFPEFSSINIIGFNSVQWGITFYGSLFARSISTGIYTTNSQQVCNFIAENSDCKLVIAENLEHAKKYFNQLADNKIRFIVLYNDPKADLTSWGGKVMHWAQFMNKGSNTDKSLVEARMNKTKPGNCATLVYTSGTTGMPKGVMISHDNFVWTMKVSDILHDRPHIPERVVSYLPLSHAAGLLADLIAPLLNGYHVFFAQPDALQGSLLQTLKQVRPTSFMSVPRIWEKIQEKMKQVASQNGWLKTKIATWAKNIGPEGTVKQARKQKTSLQFRIAKKLVYSQVKKQLGLDQTHFFIYGAAPLDPRTRQYFLSLNFFLINTYGMSESTGPQNFTNKNLFQYEKLENFKQVGTSLPGTELKIVKQNPNDEDGEICYKGRNTFMGYFKNKEETQKTIDSDGFLHSGDMGRLEPPNNILYITGRLKELIITAGGQNIPPILIENEIKAAMSFISNVMVVGDNKKYLNCLICLKQDPPGSGKLQQLCKQYLKSKQCNVSTVSEARNHPNIRKIIMEGLKKANEKAISHAQHVQHFYILPEDFTVENGALTPTLKLKRKQVTKKYANEIESLYITPKI